MSMTVGELVAYLDVDSTKFNSGVASAGGKFGFLTSKAALMSAGVIAAFAAMGIAAVKFGGEFDKAYDTIRVGTGATGPALDALKGDFKAVVKDVPTDFASAGTAIADLNTRLGLTGKPLQDVSKQFLELSRLTGTDVSENIRQGTRVFGDWSIAAKDQAGAMDQLFRASQMSGIGLNYLMGTVVEFGAPLRNMDFGFSDSVGMLAKWEKEGVNTSIVLTGLKFGLKEFAKAGKDPKEALAQLIPKMRDMKDEQAAMALGMKTFGLRAGPDMVAAIREGRFEYADFAKAIEGGSDTIAQAAADTESWQEKLTKLKNRALVGLEPVLMAAFEGLGAVFDRVAAAVDYLVPVFQSAWASISAAVSDAWAIVGPVVTRIYEVVKSYLIDNLAKAMPTLSAMWDEFKATLTVVWGRAKAFAAGVGTVIAAVVGFIRKHWGTIGPIVRNVWNAVEAVVGGALKVIASIIRAVMAAIRGDWSGAWEHIKAALSAMWDSMKTVVRNALSALKGILTGLGRKILGWIGDLGGLLKDAGRAIIQGLIDGITGKLTALWDTVSGLAGDIKDKFAGVLDIFSPSKVFRGFGVNLMEGLAAGIADASKLPLSALSGVSANLSMPSLASPSLATAGGAAVAPSAIELHVHAHLPDRTALVGTARDVAEYLAPHLSRELRTAALRRMKEH